MSEQTQEQHSTYDEFEKIIKDFLKDILRTFPEYADTMNEDLRRIVCEEDDDKSSVQTVFEYCQTIYPKRFFDILYQNNELFSNEDEEKKSLLLPGIDFKELWKCDLSEHTRTTIWKYLQLILFSVIGNMSDGDSFGDTAKLFEAINEDEFKSKLEETVQQMQDVFTKSMNENNDEEEGGGNGEQTTPNINLKDLPNADKLHSHITGMLDGKLGKLAREIAEETASELNMDDSDASTVDDVFKKLFKNPGKLMNLVKSIGGKLDKKLKSGEIKESEIMEEAQALMTKMNNMPGMGNLQHMLSQMNLGGGKGKINMGAMKNHLQMNMKQTKMRERMKQKLESKKTKEGMHTMDRSSEAFKKAQLEADRHMEELIFSTGEHVEKSSRNPDKNNKNNNNKKKKKKKKKKDKEKEQTLVL